MLQLESLSRSKTRHSCRRNHDSSDLERRGVLVGVVWVCVGCILVVFVNHFRLQFSRLFTLSLALFLAFVINSSIIVVVPLETVSVDVF